MATTSPPPAPTPPTTIRRRRAAAALLFVVVLALAVGALTSHATHHAQANTRPRRTVAPRPTPAEQKVRQQAAESAAIDRVVSYTPAIRSGGSRGDEVALTFDDGPGPYTVELVHTLDALHVKATFFAIGSQERYFSAGTVAELRAGDVVGDHTESHPMMAALSPHEQHEQLFEQILRIQLLNGPTPRLFRPPYGSFNATTFKELRKLHLLMVLWSVDTADYTEPGVQTIVQRALAGAQPGAIILLHDGGGNRSETIAALPGIVAGLRRKGLHPVTVPRLLLDDPPPRGLPLPTPLTGD